MKKVEVIGKVIYEKEILGFTLELFGRVVSEKMNQEGAPKQ